MDCSTGDIKIRPFKADDLDAAAHILTYSFKAKFHSLTNLSDEMIAELLKDSGFVANVPFEGYFVAEKDDEVLGTMLLKWKKQNRMKSQNYLNFLQLCKQYGISNILKFFLGISTLIENVTDNECYIEYIAVSPKARGLGLGTNLISFGKRFAENT